MKRVLSVVIILFVSFFSSAQLMTDALYYDEGKKLYEEDKYEEAIKKFLKAYEEDKKNADNLYYLGLSYKYSGDNENAIKYFEELKSIKPDYWGWFYYELGKAYIAFDEFEKAKENLEIFDKQFPNTPDRTLYHHQAKWLYHYADKSPEVRKNAISNIADPKNLGVKVNSKWDDYMPSTDPTGKRIYFTSKRKGGLAEDEPDDEEGDEDLYYTDNVNGEWQTPVLLPAPLNSSSNEGAPAVSADGQVMVFVGCGREEGIGSCDLYVSYLEGTKWSDPINMGNVINSENWDSQPCISSDGNRIIFTSTRDGGYGDEDIYMIEKNIFGGWGAPQNLGPTINTPFEDKSPYLSPDGKTLYFASTGHPGFGGFDLFMSTFQNGKWSDPVNLGSPINTDKNDLYFTIGGSGEHGYLSSSRNKGYLELYQVEIPENMRPQPTVIVKGIVTNHKTSQKLGAWVLVEDLNSGELIATNKSNSSTGEYLVVLPAGRNYSVSANKEGFFFYSSMFDVPLESKYKEIQKNIELKPIEKGTKVVLNNIFFETGKSNLKPESYVELNKAVSLLESNPKMVIEVGGHTDNVGSDEMNMSLSHERAKSVMDYLMKAGISASRLKAKGYGKTEPIADNETEEGRAANRRTEFVILEN